MGLSDIVTLVITRDSSAVSRASFGTMLILGKDVNVNNRYEFFTNADDAIAKVIGSDTLEEAMITAAFAQNPRVTRVMLGSIRTSKTFVFSGTYTAGSITAVANGRTYTQTFSTDLDGTLTAMAVQLAADDDIDTAEYTAGTNTLVITPLAGKAVGVTFGLTGITGTMSYVLTATELADGWDDALAAINVTKPDFYGVVAATRDVVKQTDIATWVEANKKVYIAASAEANIVDQDSVTDTTSIAAVVKAQALDRTFVVYSSAAATEGIDAAILGKVLPYDPGTYTLKFKTLSTITANTLTTTQTTNAEAKNCSIYTEIGGKNMLAEGKSGSGEYFDVIVFIDWLEARITESVFSTLVSNKKVSFTTSGIYQIATALEQPLKIGQNRGGISPTEFDSDDVQIGGYNITVPSLGSIPSADKVARTLNDVKFTAWLSGAIHFVRINGSVRV